MKQNTTAQELFNAFQKITRLNQENNFILDQLSIGELKLCMIVEEMMLKDEAITPTEIASQLMISSPAVIKTLNHLEKKGFIKRNKDLVNKKQVHIHLTEQANDFFQNEKEKLFQFSNFIVKDMGEEEVNKLIELIASLAKSIEKYHKGDKYVTVKKH